jgi:hypothetical protein
MRTALFVRGDAAGDIFEELATADVAQQASTTGENDSRLWREQQA